MSCQWCVFFVIDVTAVAVEAKPKGVACLANILFVAFCTCDKINDVV